MAEKTSYKEVCDRLEKMEVSLLSDYAGRLKPIEFKCKVCDFKDARTLDSIVASGYACRACHFRAGNSIRGVISGINDLATLYPKIAREADGWDPTTVTSGSAKSVGWVCQSKHRWTTSIGNRTGKEGTGCPICSNRVLCVGQNDLATLRPDLASEADGWDPTTVVAGTAAMKPWKCALGHTWNATLNRRISRGTGCPYCAGQYVWPGFNDFASQNPELAHQAHGWDPTTATANSGRKFEWICELGHIWKSTPDHRSRGSGCPYCLNQAVWPGFNDLATRFPDVALEAHEWDTTTVTAMSDHRKEWKCPEGHVYVTEVKRRSQGSKCPICLNDRIVSGINDLATTHPELAAEAHGWDPKTVPYGSAKPREWICKQGHVWKVAAATRSYSKSGCPYCSGNKVITGENDLKTLRPDIAAQAHGWDPSLVSVRAGVKRKWKCQEGHVWTVRVADRTGGRGCPTCAIGGFDPNADGFLYFLDHDELDMFQIGITNKPENRLATHQRGGWVVLELRGPMDGHLAQNLETDMLRVLKRRGAAFGNTLGIKRFDGWSEAWRKSTFQVSSLRQIIELVYEDDTINEPKRRKPRQGSDSAARFLLRDT